MVDRVDADTEFAQLLLIRGPWYGPSCRKQPCLNHCHVP